MLLVAVFSYYPAVSAMYHAFFRWNGEDISIYVRDRNFTELLGNYWLWIAVYIIFSAVLYTSSAKTEKADKFRILSSIMIMIITTGTIAMKGWAFAETTGEASTFTLETASAKLGIGIIIWGTVLLLNHLLISSENDRKWFYMLLPLLFISSSFLQAIGFVPVFAWAVVMLFSGCALWFLNPMERLPHIEGVRTLHSFVSLGIAFWALANFAGGDKVLWGSFSVIAILVMFNIVKMIPSVITAVVIHRLRSDKANYWYRVLFVIPMIIPGMVGLLLWKFFFNPNEGLFNRILLKTHIMDVLIWLDGKLDWGVFHEGVMPVWLGDEKLVLPAFILWGFPWIGVVGVLIYLSGLQSIPNSVYEAADLDGAGPIDKLFHIELPLILTQIRINMVLMIIGTLKSYAMILILFGDSGGPGGKLMVPGLLMFRTAFKDGAAGYACAIGLVIFFFILMLTELNNRYIRVEK
jgi:raffinose/stachyose/melibiose transport system permease protein